MNFSGYTGMCDEKEYNFASEYGNIYVEFDVESVNRLPKKYVKDGEIQGYNSAAYTFLKKQVELL